MTVHTGVSAAVLHYADRVDEDDVIGIADCYTPDAHVELLGGEVVLEGADAVRAYFAEAVRTKRSTDPPLESMHLLPSIVVEPLTDARARARSRGVLYLFGAEGPLDIRGIRYGHELVKIDGRWLIAHQVHDSPWRTQAANLA